MDYRWSFREELKQTPISLSRASLQFARAIAYPNLDIEQYMPQMQQLAELARLSISASSPITFQAEKLADFLFVYQGFRGNRAAYYDPRNSFLNELLERRLGIPISLAVLYLDIAKRLEIPAYGIDLPGHFLVGVSTEWEQLYLDPFNEGKRLTVEDCARLAQRTSGYDGPFEASWLEPMSTKFILLRMLHNLRATYLMRRAWPEALATIEHIQLIEPKTAVHQRDIGLIHLRMGNIRLAVQTIQTYLELTPDAQDSKTLRQMLKPYVDTWVSSN